MFRLAAPVGEADAALDPVALAVPEAAEAPEHHVSHFLVTHHMVKSIPDDAAAPADPVVAAAPVAADWPAKATV